MADAVDTILSTAESELKKWGGDSVTLLHLAIAISIREPESFDSVFGSAGLSTIKGELRAGRYGKSGATACDEVLALGRSASNPRAAALAIAEGLRDRLGDLLALQAATSEPDGDSGALLR